MTIDEERPLLSRDGGEDSSLQIPSRASASTDFGEDNPLEWSPSFKWIIVALLSSIAFTVSFTCLSILPSANHIIRKLNNGESDKSASVLLVTIWELGEAAGPLFIAPLSEMFGRYAVLNAANTLFVTATILTALSDSVPLLIASRALTGLAVASNVLNPAIIGDIMVPEQRGTAMTIMITAPLIACAIGPAIGGAIAESYSWRHVAWISAALAGACQVVVFAFFKETYRIPRQGPRTTVPAVEESLTEESKSNPPSFWDSAVRPASILCSSGVLAALCLCHSLDFFFYYVMAVTLPDILQDVYGQSLSMTGVSFVYFSEPRSLLSPLIAWLMFVIPIAIGSGVSLVICNLTLDKLYKKLRDRHGGIDQPEFRLPLAIVGAFGAPAAILLYGWSAHLHLPVPFLFLSLVLLGLTTNFSCMSVYTYVVDAFGIYSASAMAGVIVTRCISGAFLPLLVVPLVQQFGYGLGFTALGALSLSVAPIPILVMRHGSKWRQFSRYTNGS